MAEVTATHQSQHEQDRSPERLVERLHFDEQFVSQYAVLAQHQLLERSPEGVLGVHGIDGEFYRAPNRQLVLELLERDAEQLNTKADQGFDKLLLVPFALPTVALYDRYDEALKPFSKKQGLSPRKRWRPDIYPGMDYTSYAENPPPSVVFGDEDDRVVYFPKGVDDPTDGRTKRALLKEPSGTPGWMVLLIEDLPQLPGYGAGKEVGGRPQLEANEEIGYLDADKIRKQLTSQEIGNDYLRTIRTDPHYAGEVPFTPEMWLSYAISRLTERDEIIDMNTKDSRRMYLLGVREADTPPWNASIGTWSAATFSPWRFTTGSKKRGVRTAVVIS